MSHASRRAFLRALSGVAVAALSAACGRVEPPSAPTPAQASKAAAPAEKASAKASVEIWTGYGQGRMADAMNGSIDRFNQTSTKFEGKHVVVPWGDIRNKVIAAVSAGNPPDTYRNSSWIIGQDAPAGALTPLDDYVKAEADIKLDDFWPATLEQMKYQGKIYGLSISTTVELLFYNKDRLKEKGLDATNLPDTLEGWEEYGTKLTETSNGKLAKLGFVPFIPRYAVYGWSAAHGATFYDENTQKVTANHPAVVQVLEWFGSYGARYGAENIQAFVSSFGGNDFGRNTPEGVYYTGLLSMWGIGTWLYNDMKEYGPKVDFGVAKIPSPKGVQGKPGQLHANVYVVPKGAKNPDGAFAFANFITSDRWVAINKVAVDSVTPSRKSLAHDPDFEKAAPWIKIARDEILPHALPLPVMPSVTFFLDRLTEAAQAVLFNGAKPKEALDDANERVQREVDKNLGR